MVTGVCRSPGIAAFYTLELYEMHGSYIPIVFTPVGCGSQLQIAAVLGIQEERRTHETVKQEQGGLVRYTRVISPDTVELRWGKR